MRNLKIDKKCVECGKKFTLEVNQNDYDDWKSGKLVQKAFPYLKAGERELLISGLCEDCFDKLFEDDN